jgi:flagellar basal body-associated protein FliL
VSNLINRFFYSEEEEEQNHFIKSALGVVIAILIVLTIVSAVLLAIKLVNYMNVDEMEVRLKTNMDTELDIFSVQYENASGNITVSGLDGQKVVAPGTTLEHTIRFRNADSRELDYEIVPEVKYTSEYKIPLLIRMVDTELNYLIGDEKTWVRIEDIEAASASDTLPIGGSDEFYFQWKWDYETGNDAYDTELGNAAKTQDIGVEVSLAIHAEITAEGGPDDIVMRSKLGHIIILIVICVLLLTSIILTTIVIIKRREYDEYYEDD